MLSLKELKQYYPENIQDYGRFIVREYLQYKMLEIVFDNPVGNKLSFLGGTCLRIVHNSQRFSEDLDFDNFGLSDTEFDALTLSIKSGLEKLGYEVEMRNVKKGAYHFYIRFPGILLQEGLTSHKEEKILIRLDSEAQGFDYPPDQPLINKIDVLTQISSTPATILLAQKFYALLNRKKNKGRDFFDIVFLLAKGLFPDYRFLQFKLGLESSGDLRKSVLAKCAELDMQEMADDVKPFLFEKNDVKKILLFPKYIEQANLG